MAKMTQEAFIDKAKLKAKDNLDLSHYIYNGANSKSKVICKNDNIEFEMKASAILNGTNGCSKCGGKKGFTQEQFIEKAQKVHNNQFDYSMTEYKAMRFKIKVKCIKHDKIIEQKAQGHIDGLNPCPDCNGQTPITGEIFILRSKEGHGENKFDYSKVPEKFPNGIHSPVELKCLEHNIWFTQEAWAHLRPSNGCPEERNNIKKTLQDIIEHSQKVYPDKKYDYSQIDLAKSVREKVKIGCPIEGHGFFEQSLNNHLNHGKEGCQICHKINITADKNMFIEKIEKIFGNGKYSFDNTIIDNGLRGRVTITCMVNGHGDFDAGIQYLLQGNDPCPGCAVYGVSKAERDLGDFVESLGFEVKRNVRGILDNRKEVDIWIPSKNVAIEFHGLYWHTEDKVGTDKHRIKYDLSEHNGIHLVQVWEDDWKLRDAIVKKHLRAVLSLTEKRKFQFREMDPVDVSMLCDVMHVDGRKLSNFALGGYVNDKLECVIAITRVGNGYEIEQYVCVSENDLVLDDVAQFLVDEYQAESVVSRMDLCWNDSYVYGDSWIVSEVEPPSRQFVVNNTKVSSHYFIGETEVDVDSYIYDAGNKLFEFRSV